jgi:hypothetical protein
MKSVRLTVEMRNMILGRLLQHTFGERQEAIRKDELAFGRDVYDDVYDPLMRRRMRSLPDGFLHKSTGLYVTFGGQHDKVDFGELRNVAARHESCGVAISYPADDPLTARHADLNNRRRRLKEERDGARSQAKAVLYNVSTLKKRLEVWPEVSSFVKDLQGSAAPTELALPIKSLNEILGLPPAEQAPAPALAKRGPGEGSPRRGRRGAGAGSRGTRGVADARV